MACPDGLQFKVQLYQHCDRWLSQLCMVLWERLDTAWIDLTDIMKLYNQEAYKLHAAD